MATFQELTGNIESLENATYASFFDVEKFFMDNIEAGKKFLQSIHPELTEENLEMVMGTVEKGKQKIDDEEKKREEEEEKQEKEREEQEDAQDEEEPEETREQRRQQRRDERAKRKDERKKKREERKKKRKEQLDQTKKIYKDKKEQIIKQVKEIKKRIKETIHKLFAEWLSLIQKLSSGLIKSVQSLVAAIITAVAPPWNIPSAIVILLEVIEFYLDLLKQLRLVAPILGPLQYLPIVIQPDKLGVVSSVLNPIIKAILFLYTPIAKFNAFIEKLLNKIIEFIGNTIKKNRSFRKASRRLKKLNYCQNPVSNITEDNRGDVDEDDVEEVQEILEIYKTGQCQRVDAKGVLLHGRLGEPGKCQVCVTGYKVDPDPDKDNIGQKALTDFKNSLKGDFVNNTIQKGEEEGNYVYDVLLPSGEVLLERTESQLELLKKQYTLLFTNL